jgi:hypothetical protein
VYLQAALKLYVTAASGCGAPGAAGASGAPGAGADLLSLADTDERDGPAATPVGSEAGPPAVASALDDLMGPPAPEAPPVASPAPTGDILDDMLGPSPALGAGAAGPVPAGAGPPPAGASGELHALLEARLPAFEVSTLLEVQERAALALRLLALVRDAGAVVAQACPPLHARPPRPLSRARPGSGRVRGSRRRHCAQLPALFCDELNPVAPKAQGKVRSRLEWPSLAREPTPSGGWVEEALGW